MTKPVVAIVGRPNVGKSTFFNRITGSRTAITDDMPGVTRDRIYGDADWGRYQFTLIDTGGIDPTENDSMFAYMREQAQTAIDTADVVILFVDGRQGVTGDDEDVADMLRRAHKPVVIAVNKLDNVEKHGDAYEFYSLGIGEPVAISATLGLGINDVLDAVVSFLPDPQETEEGHEDDTVHIAIVGKPNAGKSSLVNTILGENRVIVSDVAGTTRDAIDTPIVRNGQRYVLIDTAGIRRKRSIEKNTVERFGVIRALAAIRRADVAVIVVDAAAGLTEQDVKIAGYVHEEGRACILVVNKWDLIEKDAYTMDAFKRKLAGDLSFMSYIPMLFTSALTGQRVDKIFTLVQQAYQQSITRIATGVLNEVLMQAVAASEPPSDKGRRLKIYYATQVSVKPPTFILFVNEPDLLHFSYRRYLENYMRKTFGFEGTPIRFIIRKRDNKEG